MTEQRTAWQRMRDSLSWPSPYSPLDELAAENTRSILADISSTRRRIFLDDDSHDEWRALHVREVA